MPYKYKRIPKEHFKDFTIERLNLEGEDEWEICGIDNEYYIFKKKYEDE